jgi:predicted enzyme related to lactoylglutathione lyase
MERVQGIGGVFFRTRDPEALGAWYREHLGVPVEEGNYAVFGGEGQTVWSAFAGDTDYFGPSGQQFMLNFRVEDLDAMLRQLRAAGVAVDERVEDSELGRFGWFTDPDGNRVELWQPPES